MTGLADTEAPVTAPAGPSRYTTHIAYRGDIDGLRALAVVPVVLYHAGVRGFSGGFVGVDIFFVISGYLITGILMREQALGRLSIAEFYRRRILRIFPALGAMAIAATIGATLFLLPGEWERYARSLAGTALFGSNIVFYLATDYFNIGALSEPLLHTWSLAVEEQWYLVWPLVIVAIGPKRPRLMLALVAAIIILSLAYAMWLLPRDPSAAFYMLPARAWEMGMGALLAIGAWRPWPRWVAEVLSVIGIALIAFAVKFYQHTTPFPGLSAVPPCLGAALLIHGGKSSTLVARVLAAPPLRQIGLISYSLYLWHWPVIVFAGGGLFIGHGIGATVGLLATMVLLAWLSWRFVERPFRVGAGDWSTPRVLTGGAVAIAAMLGVALAVPPTAQALSGYTAREKTVASYIFYRADDAYRGGTCFRLVRTNPYDRGTCLPDTGKPGILIVGDSHAAHLWPGFSRLRDHYDVQQATSIACFARLPTPGNDPDKCGAVAGYALHDWLRTHRPAHLILASRWQLRALRGLEETLRDPLVRRSNPVLIGPVPQYVTELPRLIIAARRRNDPGLTQRMLLDEPFAVDRVLRDMAKRTGTPYFSPIDLLCDAQRRCRTLVAGDVPMQFDYGHLTAPGSAFVTDAIMASFAPTAR
ncbi:MAG: acyltransferase family protein [Sphingobium sp.]